MTIESACCKMIGDPKHRTRRRPDLAALEGKQHWLGNVTGPLVCGVDEAGRGPLAGPVVAAAVILPDDFDITGIDDSKLLSPARRETQRRRIMESSALWAIGIAEHETIDEINIMQASFLAMRRAIRNLKVTPDIVLVDGRFQVPGLTMAQRAVVDGDHLEPCIAAASILAKTFRDDLMIELAERYPGYGFEKHKGYPTEEHVANLLRLGPCPIHRKSFHPVSMFFQDARN